MAEATSLADRILIGRRARSFSQAELARRSGIPQPQLSKLERGQIRQPAFSDIVALAAALEIHLEAFASDSPDLFLQELRRLATLDDEPQDLAVMSDGEIRTVVSRGPIEFDMHTREERQQLIDNFAALIDEFDPALTELVGWVGERRNFLIVGPTGSGKTTLLRTLLEHVDPTERIVAIEDVDEIKLNHPNAKTFTTRYKDGTASEITTDMLIRFALRKWSDRLVIGEIRGPEAYEALSAWNTGHEGSFATIHGTTAKSVLDKLELLVGSAGQIGGAGARQLIGRTVNIVVTLNSSKEIASVSQVLLDGDGRLVLRDLYVRTGDGLQRIAAPLETEHTAVFDRRPALQMPTSGVVIGQGALSGQPVIFNRFAGQHSPHLAIVGAAGSGKHYFAKLELLRLRLLGAAVGVIDVSGEYRSIAASDRELTSFVYGAQGVVNPLDFTLNGEVKRHINFVCEWLEAYLRAAGADRLVDPVSRAIVAQALRETYKRYDYKLNDTEASSQMPTLSDLVQMLTLIQRRSSDETVQVYIRPLLAALNPLTGGGIYAGLCDRQTQLPDGMLVADLSQVDPGQLEACTRLLMLALQRRLQTSDAAQKVMYVDGSSDLLNDRNFAAWILRNTQQEGIGVTLIADRIDVESYGIFRQIGTTVLLRQHPSGLAALREIFDLTEQESRRLTTLRAGSGMLLKSDGSGEFLTFTASDAEHRLITTEVRFMQTQGLTTIFPFQAGNGEDSEDDDDDGLAGAPVRV